MILFVACTFISFCLFFSSGFSFTKLVYISFQIFNVSLVAKFQVNISIKNEALWVSYNMYIIFIKAPLNIFFGKKLPMCDGWQSSQYSLLCVMVIAEKKFPHGITYYKTWSLVVILRDHWTFRRYILQQKVYHWVQTLRIYSLDSLSDSKSFLTVSDMQYIDFFLWLTAAMPPLPLWISPWNYIPNKLICS